MDAVVLRLVVTGEVRFASTGISPRSHCRQKVRNHRWRICEVSL